MTTTHSNTERAAAATVRPIETADAADAARIVYEAFAGIHDHHRFPRDFPVPEAAIGLVESFIAHPAIWGVAAEAGGRLVGSNFLDERGPVTGVGPITVDPNAQETGVGRALMEAVIERGREARGVRLLQDAFNTRSLALYSSLGFVVREPVVLLGGRPRDTVAPRRPAELEVRPLVEADIAACEALQLRVHGFERTEELRDALTSPLLEPFVAVRDRRIVAYAAGVTFFAASFGAAETEADLFGLIAGALEQAEAEAHLLLPAGQTEVLRSCLAAGLRIVKPMTYMTLGEWKQPAGAWFPSVLY